MWPLFNGEWPAGWSCRRLISDSRESSRIGFDSPSLRYVSLTRLLAAYPEAVDQFFGPYAAYGQLRKEYRNATMQYTPSEMVGTDRRGIFGIDVDKLWSICTSHVERHNLTIRTLMKRFTRLNLGFTKKLDNLQAACQVFLAYYNFVWRTRYDDNSGRRGQLRPPAAMMAGVVDTYWDFERLYDEAMAS